MKYNKIMLTFLVILSTLSILPTKAEEQPTIDIVQLEDGSIKVSSDNQELIEDFISFVLSDGKQDVNPVAQRIGDSLVFEKPELTGEIDYLFSYMIEETVFYISGKCFLDEITKDPTVHNVDPNGNVKPSDEDDDFWFDCWQDNDAIYIYTEYYGGEAKFKAKYSTSKNGKYKNAKSFYVGSYIDDEENELVSFQVFKITKIKPYKKYYIKARYIEYWHGSIEYISPWEKESLKTTAGTPTNIKMDINSDGSFKVEWKKAKGAKKYRLTFYYWEEGFDQSYDDALWDAYKLANTARDQAWEDVWEYEEEYLGTVLWDEIYYNSLLAILDAAANVCRAAEAAIDDYEDMYIRQKVYTTSKTSVTFKANYFNTADHFEMYVYGFKKKNYDGGDIALVETNPLVYTPVTNVTVAANQAGSEVIFNFNTTMDLNKYPLWREDGFSIYRKSGNLGQKKTSVKKAESVFTKYINKTSVAIGYVRKNYKLKQYNGMISDNPNTRMVWSYLDFKLFAATKKAGPYKLVDTVAEFGDHNNLRLRYKTVGTKKLYYKIMPTWDRLVFDCDFSEGWSMKDVINDNIRNYSLKSYLTTTVTEYALLPGKPQNILGEALGKNKVKISVDKGVSVKGYELYNADTNKLIKSQKSNVFKITAANGVAINYEIRSYRLDGKKKIYSAFSDPVSITAYN